MDYPRAGAHYPRSTGEFLAWFRTDEDCLDYLEWLRWPGGFACPHCGNAGGWRLADGRVECGDCSRRTSVTAGTIFDKTRTPLTVWFHACWLFATAKDGISAQYLQRSLEIGSYQTAWAMLHRLRSALVRPGRGRLTGTVEVDETFIGGEEHGLSGGRQPGKKVLTGIAVEVSEPKGIGRCRMAVLADASGASLRPFVAGNVEPGSRVITDGWVGYNGLAARGYDHERRNQAAAARRGEDPGELLPAVHRVASLCKRWLLGTHQGKVAPAHLPAYLNEFTFRFNRRHSRSRGMVFYRVLELAAGHDPVRYNDIRATTKPRNRPPRQRGTGHPPSLDRPAADRPWRTSEMQLQSSLKWISGAGLRAATFHTCGIGPGSRAPASAGLLTSSGSPCPGNAGCWSGRRGPATAASSIRLACSSLIPNTSRYVSRRSIAGTFSAGTSSTRIGTNLPSLRPGTFRAAADHSSAVYRDRSKYAAENKATNRSHRSSASLIAVTKLRPTTQSHTSSSTVNPACISCQATHSAHARSTPAWLTKKSTRSPPTHPVSAQTTRSRSPGGLIHLGDDGLAAAVIIERRPCPCCRGERPDPGRDPDRRAAARPSTAASGCRGWDRASG